jgi:hypothetical protein
VCRTAADNATNSTSHVVLRTVHLDGSRLGWGCSDDLLAPSVHRSEHGSLDLTRGIKCLLLLLSALHAVQSCCERAGSAPQGGSKAGEGGHGGS